MSAAFVPTFTRSPDARGRDRRPGASATTSSTRCSSPPACSSLLGDRLRRAARHGVRGGLRQRAGQARADDAADADHAAVPDDWWRWPAALMGMLNSLNRFFVPALSPAMFNVGSIACAVAARAGHAARRPAADRGHGDRRARRRPRPARDPVAARCAGRASGTGRSSTSRDPGLRAGADPDGPGHARPRGDADQRLRQHGARDRRGHRRGVVAELRLPPDVPADRHLRRVDRDGGDARHRRGTPRARRPGGHAPRGRRRPRDDADAERAGDRRAHRARAADRRDAVRTRRVHGRTTPRRRRRR